MAVPFGSDQHSGPVTITIHPLDRNLVAEAMSDLAMRQDSEGHIRRRRPSVGRAYEDSARRLRRLAAEIGDV